MEKNNRKVIKELMQKLDSICGDYKEYRGMLDYIKMAECTARLLDLVFGKDNYTLPIDIDKVIQYFDIEVVEINLNDNEENQERSNRIVGELSIRPQILGQGKIKRIYIDSETTLYTQRYALAHELGHYLINENRNLFSDEYCIMPLLPKDAEELVADAFAVSLLIPIKTFVREFNVYINEERKSGKLPISTEEWLQYLSTSARVSYHYVACGYQQLRCVAFWLYQYRIDKILIEDKSEEDKKTAYEELEKRKKEYPVLTEKIESSLSDEIIKRLFQ